MMHNFNAQEVIEILIEVVKYGNQENVLREAQKN
jgi:Ca2+-binding EF-hand superfamily protein